MAQVLAAPFPYFGAAKRLANAEHRKVVNDYIEAEVHPWVPDAWVDHTKTKIDAELKALEAEVQRLLAEVTE